MTSTRARYLLCRPEGGLNDQLNQIAKCVRYGREVGRLVLIDSARCGFGESHHYYFRSTSTGIVNDSSRSRNLLQPLMEVEAPACLSRMSFDYRVEYDDRFGNFVESSTRAPLAADFSRDYADTLVLHHACGGGVLGVDALADFELAPAVREIALRRRKSLPDVYFALHIRHTDYRTNYTSVFDDLSKNEIFAARHIPIYLATDNPEVVRDARKIFDVPVFNFSCLPPADGGLHNTNQLPKFVVNTDSICDLMLLALGNGFFAPPMVQGSYSGFSVLAQQLRERPQVVKRLLGL